MDTAYLLIHGFAGSREEVASLYNEMKRQNMSAYCTILKGHEKKRKDLAVSTYHDWISSAETEMIEIMKQHSEVVLVGFSMGGLIAVNLCNKYNIKKLVLINTPVYFWDVNKICVNILSDFRNRKLDNIKRYIKVSVDKPMKSLKQFLEILQYSKDKFENVKCPALVIQSKNDDTVKWKSAEYIYGKLQGEKTLKYYDGGCHQILQSEISMEVVSDVIKFLK